MLACAAWLILAATPAPTRVALMPLSAGEGVPEKTAEALTESVAAELRRIQGLQIITRQEISAVLSLERQKEMLACQTDSCVSEIGGALDVDRLVIGNLAKLGASWMIHLQLVDSRKAITTNHSDRRKKGGSVDDVLDEIPAMVHELFPLGAPVPRPVPVAIAPTPAGSQVQSPKVARPSPGADSALDLGADRAKLQVVSDRKGHYVAFVPFGGTGAPLLAGTAQVLYKQRVTGGGSQGNTQFSLSFWEPRAAGFAGGQFMFREGSYHLYCDPHQVSFTLLTDKEARQLLSTAKVLDTRWRRSGYALARDDEGGYFYVDGARDPQPNSDFRAYVGAKGKLEPQPTEVLVHDAEGDVLGLPGGKLKLSHQRREAEWVQGTERGKLTYLSVEENTPLIYGALGAYRGEQLGTACDFVLAADSH